MKTFFLLIVFILVNLTSNLTVKEEVHGHLMNGRIAGKGLQHNLKAQGQDKTQAAKISHKKQQVEHNGRPYSSSSDWNHNTAQSSGVKGKLEKKYSHSLLLNGETSHKGAVNSRLHQQQAHDEFSAQLNNHEAGNGNNHNSWDQEGGDYGDSYNQDNEEYDEFDHKDYQHKMQGIIAPSHKQNDYDQPNNGARYYYVDEDKAIEEQTSSSTTSISLNGHIDYNNPINTNLRTTQTYKYEEILSANDDGDMIYFQNKANVYHQKKVDNQLLQHHKVEQITHDNFQERHENAQTQLHETQVQQHQIQGEKNSLTHQTQGDNLDRVAQPLQNSQAYDGSAAGQYNHEQKSTVQHTTQPLNNQQHQAQQLAKDQIHQDRPTNNSHDDHLAN